MLDIPVFHDDQHGTAIVVLAALTNALRVVGKELADVRIVMSGAGAAGTAILRLLLAAGARDVVVADVDGVVHRGRDGPRTSRCAWIAEHTNRRGLTGDLQRARSRAPTSSSASPRPTSSTATTSPRWPTDAIVFALANPDPEVDPASAREHAAVVATGRSDYPNQINNVLAFPGVFRGLLDASGERRHRRTCCSPRPRRSPRVVTDDELNANYIIPSVFHADVANAVAAAVRESAGGRARGFTEA